MMNAEARLKELGFELPEVPKPVAEYVPAKRAGDLVYVSGQGPIRDGTPVYIGRVGAEVSPEDAYKAAQICALNCLAAVKSLVGSLDAVEEIVQKVVNGASELLVKLFGERGRHARAALGTSNLPLNIPVEVELVARVRKHIELERLLF